MAGMEDMARRMKHMHPDEIAEVFSQLQHGQLVLQDAGQQEHSEPRDRDRYQQRPDDLHNERRERSRDRHQERPGDRRNERRGQEHDRYQRDGGRDRYRQSPDDRHSERRERDRDRHQDRPVDRRNERRGQDRDRNRRDGDRDRNRKLTDDRQNERWERDQDRHQERPDDRHNERRERDQDSYNQEPDDHQNERGERYQHDLHEHHNEMATRDGDRYQQQPDESLMQQQPQHMDDHLQGEQNLMDAIVLQLQQELRQKRMLAETAYFERQSQLKQHLMEGQIRQNDFDAAMHELELEMQMTQREVESELQQKLILMKQEMMMRGQGAIEDQIKQRLLQSRLNKALESSTSEEQTNLFAARMMGASDDRMMAGPSGVGTSNDAMMAGPSGMGASDDRMLAGPSGLGTSDDTMLAGPSGVPVMDRRMMASHNVSDAAVVAQPPDISQVVPPHLLEQLQQGNTEVNALEVLAQFGRQLREQQNAELTSQPQLNESGQVHAPATLPLVMEPTLPLVTGIGAALPLVTGTGAALPLVTEPTLPLVTGTGAVLSSISEGQSVSMSWPDLPEASLGHLHVSGDDGASDMDISPEVPENEAYDYFYSNEHGREMTDEPPVKMARRSGVDVASEAANQESERQECSIFVGGAILNVGHANLQAYFKKFGHIKAFSWLPGSTNKEYCFIRFSSASEAAAAYEAGTKTGGKFRRHVICDQDINVGFANTAKTVKPDTNTSGNQKGTKTATTEQQNMTYLFAYRIPADMSFEDLKKYFNDKYREVEFVEKRQGKEYAIIRFYNYTSAMAAFNGGFVVGECSQHNIGGAIVNCLLRSKEQIDSMQDFQQPYLCLDKIAYELYSRHELEAYFSKFGSVNVTELISQLDEKFSFGHVIFKSLSDAEIAFQCGESFKKGKTKRKHYIGDKFVTVFAEAPTKEEGKTKEVREACDRLFAYPIPSKLSYQDLKKYFNDKYGKVVYVEKRLGKEYAIIRFLTYTSAMAAFNGGIVNGECSQHNIGGALVNCVLRSQPEIESMSEIEEPHLLLDRSSYKLFSRHELEAYFSKFGPVLSVKEPSQDDAKFPCQISYKSSNGAEIAFQCGMTFGKNLAKRKHFIGNKFVTVFTEAYEREKSKSKEGRKGTKRKTSSKDSAELSVHHEGTKRNTSSKDSAELSVHREGTKRKTSSKDLGGLPVNPEGTKRKTSSKDSTELSVHHEDRYKFHLGGIGDLTTEQIERYFSRFAQVIDVKLHGKDSERIPYGFVQFDWLTETDAEKISGNHDVGGWTVRVNRAKTTASDNCRFHIPGIEDLRASDLHEYFSQFGRLIDVQVCRSPPSQSGRKHYAFVEYDRLSEDDRIRLLGTHTVLGVELKVITSREKAGMSTEESKSKQLTGKHKRYHLKGVKNLRAADIKKHFSIFGELVDVTMSGTRGLRKPYGHIEFANLSDGDELVDVLGNHNINGIIVTVERAKTKDFGEPSFALPGLMDQSNWGYGEQSRFGQPGHMERSQQWGYEEPSRFTQPMDVDAKVDSIVMSNIPKAVTEDDVRKHFQKFGDLDDVKVMHTAKRSFGFIQFKTMEAVGRALRSGTRGSQRSVLIKVNNFDIDCEREIADGGDSDSVKQQKKQKHTFGGVAASPPSVNTTIFVYGIPEVVTTERMATFFTKFGKVETAQHHIGKKRGILNKTQMLIKFANIKAVRQVMMIGQPQRAQKLLDIDGGWITKLKIGSFHVHCKLFKIDKKEVNVYHTLFIRGIDDKIVQDDLTAYFSTFGHVHIAALGRTHGAVATQGWEEPRNGLGIVRFKEPSSLENAMKNQNHRGIAEHCIRDTVLECEPVSSKEMRYIKYPDEKNSSDLKRAQAVLKTFRFHCTICTAIINNDSGSWTQHLQTKRHISVVQNILEPHMCESCKICFADGDQLANHLSTIRHEEMTRLQDYLERNPGDLNKAQQNKDLLVPGKVPSKATIICLVCSVKVPGEKCFQVHMQSRAHNERFNLLVPKGLTSGQKACAVCKMVFEHQAAHSEHVRLSWLHKVNSGEAKVYRCDMCNVNFTDEFILKAHMNTQGVGAIHEKKKKELSGEIVPPKRAVYSGKRAPIPCVVCNVTVTGELNLLNHVGSVNHKEKLDVWIKKGFTEGSEKLCALCRLVLGNEAALCDHVMFSWIHKVNSGEAIAYKCDICNRHFLDEYGLKTHMEKTQLFHEYKRKKADHELEHSVTFGDYKGQLLSGEIIPAAGAERDFVAQGAVGPKFSRQKPAAKDTSMSMTVASLPFRSNPAKRMKQQEKVHTTETKTAASGQADKKQKVSSYQQKRDQIAEQFQWDIPEILKKNPNWSGEVKGTEYVKPGYNCKVCCKFCEWNRDKEGPLSKARSTHCYSDEHSKRNTRGTQVGGSSGTIPGIFCEICKEFFDFDESHFADMIADHCGSLKHHLHIKLHRLKNNMKLPKWLQKPPFDLDTNVESSKTGITHHASHIPESNRASKQARSTPAIPSLAQGSNQNQYTNLQGKRKRNDGYGGQDREWNQAQRRGGWKGGDSRNDGDSRQWQRRDSDSNRQQYTYDRGNPKQANEMKKWYKSNMQDAEQKGGYVSSKSTTDGMGYSSLGTVKGYDTSSYQEYETTPMGGSSYGNKDSSNSGYGNKDSSNLGYGNKGSSNSGYGNKDSSNLGYGNKDSSNSGYGYKDSSTRDDNQDYDVGGYDNYLYQKDSGYNKYEQGTAYQRYDSGGVTKSSMSGGQGPSRSMYQGYGNMGAVAGQGSGKEGQSDDVIEIEDDDVIEIL